MTDLYFKTRGEWHKWLLVNHDKATEVWIIYYKKHTKMPTVSYEDAVLEALSFGWIDGKVTRIDEEKYRQRFTPRRKNSVWSETNVNRIKKLIDEGRMTKAGLTAAEDVLSGKINPEPGSFPNSPMPKELRDELRKDSVAWENFSNFPLSTKKIFYFWIRNAKRDETRDKRIQKTIKAAVENNKLGYM